MATTPSLTLTALPVFRGLSPEQAAALTSVAEAKRLPAGTFLFHEGDMGDALFIIIRGKVDVLKEDKAGGQQVLASLTDGSVLGEMSLVGGSGPRSASARTETEVEVLRLPLAALTALLQRDDVAALKLVHNLAKVLGRRLQLMDEKLVDVLGKGKSPGELSEFQRILSDWSF